MDSKDTQVREKDFLFHFSLIGLVSVGNYIGDGAQGGGEDRAWTVSRWYTYYGTQIASKLSA